MLRTQTRTAPCPFTALKKYMVLNFQVAYFIVQLQFYHFKTNCMETNRAIQKPTVHGLRNLIRVCHPHYPSFHTKKMTSLSTHNHPIPIDDDDDANETQPFVTTLGQPTPTNPSFFSKSKLFILFTIILWFILSYTLYNHLKQGHTQTDRKSSSTFISKQKPESKPEQPTPKPESKPEQQQQPEPHPKVLFSPIAHPHTIDVGFAQSIQNEQCGATSGVPNDIIQPKNTQFANEWQGYSPSLASLQNNETDFVEWRKQHEKEWSDFSSMEDGPDFDNKKAEMNEKVFVLNGHMKQTKGHLPIWIKCYKRTHPLDVALDAICKNMDIEQTVLIVTIDGGSFGGILDTLINRVKCVKVKIFFHAYGNSLKQLGIPHEPNTIPKILNTHYSYGLYLTLKMMDYPYVLTMEDDLEVSPDFYRYHVGLYQQIYVDNKYGNRETIFSITPYPHGRIHDCKFIASKFADRDACGLKNVDSLILEDYFPGWGSGVTKSAFWEYWSVWKEQMQHVYDGMMSRIRKYGDRKSIIPCSPRIRTLPNDGTNGRSNYKWANYLSQFASWDRDAFSRNYKFIN